MKRNHINKKPPLKKGNDIYLNIDNSKYRNIMLSNITASYTVFNIKKKEFTKHKIQYIHEVEPRDFRLGNHDPLYIYTLLYGVTKIIKKKDERYIDDICWINIGCKGGEDFNRDFFISELSIDNYGKYIFWELDKTNSQHFKYIKNFVFHPEEVARFNKDMATLFRVVKKNPI